MMGKRLHEKKRHRANNAGGVPVDAYQAALAIANIMHALRPKTSGAQTAPTTELSVYHIYFLYLWLTGALSEISSPNELPDLTLVSGSADCGPHQLRRIREGGISWVEYALAYPQNKKTVYLWQPMPDAMNGIFSYWLTNHKHDLHLNNAQRKDIFEKLKVKKLRTPDELRCQLVLKKDVFYRYFALMANGDPYLSLPANNLLSSSKAHHHSALSYQTLNSDQIRYEIFCAHNRYLQRLISEINQHQMKPFCDVRLPTSHALVPILSTLQERPPYIKKEGTISSFTLEMTEGARIYIPMDPIHIGSTRTIKNATLSRFFNDLRQQLTNRPEKSSSPEILREYYNSRTYELALLFILLTGTRPTHHISIERNRCFDLQRALIKDKGRYRLITLPIYLQHAIKDYLALQASILNALAPHDASTMTILWYLIDENNTACPLSAKTLRLFMNTQWQRCFSTESDSSLKNVVPYQLRHSFAQHALMVARPRLTRQQIDLLMGHSELGEHLGSAYSFKACDRILQDHLNHWPTRLHLTPFSHTPPHKESAL
ncbi:MAG: site-specific integrase [Vibrio hibernica]